MDTATLASGKLGGGTANYSENSSEPWNEIVEIHELEYTNFHCLPGFSYS